MHKKIIIIILCISLNGLNKNKINLNFQNKIAPLEIPCMWNPRHDDVFRATPYFAEKYDIIILLYYYKYL